MAVPLVVNGVTYQYPVQFDKNWGPTLTNWSTAVTNGMLQKAGGTFTLTAEVDFGATYGLAVAYLKSKASTIAATGNLRLENAAPGIVWRNAANSADLPLTVNAANQLTFNGTSIGATTSLTNSHILVGNVSNQPADVAMSGDITITNAGVTAIGAGKVLDANVNASAAITLSKLAPTTAYYWYVANASGVLTPVAVAASKNVVTDANGLPSTISSPTLTELGYVGGVTSAIQTQITAKVAKSGDTMSGALNMGSNKITSLTQGSNTGEAISYPVGTAQLSANSVTQVQTSASANTISDTSFVTVTSVTITTTGGPVLLIGNLIVSGSTASNAYQVTAAIELSGATTLLPGSIQQNRIPTVTSPGSTSFDTSFSPNVVVTPVAGTYTYLLRYLATTGSSISVTYYSLQAIELKR